MGWLRAHVRVGGAYPLVSARVSKYRMGPPAEREYLGPEAADTIQIVRYAMAVAQALADGGAPPRELEVDAVLHAGGSDLVRLELHVAGEVSGIDQIRLAEIAEQVLADSRAADAFTFDAQTHVITTLRGATAPTVQTSRPPAAQLAAPSPVGRAGESEAAAEPEGLPTRAGGSRVRVPKLRYTLATAGLVLVVGLAAAALAGQFGWLPAGELANQLAVATSEVPSVAGAVVTATNVPIVVVAEPTATAVAAPTATAAPVPTATALPAEPTATAVVALTATAVPAEPTATAAPAPTATAIVAAPTATPAVAAPSATPTAAAPTLRSVVDVSPTLGASLAWPNDPQSTAWFAADGYHLRSREAGQFVAVGAVPDQQLRDVFVSASFHKVGGPSGGGYGIIVRDSAPVQRDGRRQDGRYYVLEVGDRGEVGIWRRDEDHWVELLGWTAHPAVASSVGDNTLTARAVGNQLTLSVNSTDVAVISDATLAQGGVGVFLGGDSNEAVLTRLRVQALE